MKKICILLICLLLIPISVKATGGALRGNTIKTCPNGVTYGLHSDGKGGTHWHIAITNGDKYYPDGEAMDNDPCPGYNSNEGTAGATNGGSSNSSSSSSNKSNENNAVNTTKETTKRTVTTSEQQTTQQVTTIEPNTENNTEEESEQHSIPTIVKFVLGAGEVEFKNNKADIKKLSNEKSLEYSYELSDKDATLELYINDRKVEKLDGLKDNDVIRLVVSDKYNNQNIYEIKVHNASVVYTIIIYGFASLVMLAPIVIIIFIIVKIKKKH